ncbi:hypothetical protein SDC9_82967 [bioreactor metagenome]|uniref:Uncharacterized protein n=1 Tax=bioreactor metagenome TaxID=1076179 RepID=A0A644Z8Q1_9ZZZZ
MGLAEQDEPLNHRNSRKQGDCKQNRQEQHRFVVFLGLGDRAYITFIGDEYDIDVAVHHTLDAYHITLVLNVYHELLLFIVQMCKYGLQNPLGVVGRISSNDFIPSGMVGENQQSIITFGNRTNQLGQNFLFYVDHHHIRLVCLFQRIEAHETNVCIGGFIGIFHRNGSEYWLHILEFRIMLHHIDGSLVIERIGCIHPLGGIGRRNIQHIAALIEDIDGINKKIRPNIGSKPLQPEMKVKCLY